MYAREWPCKDSCRVVNNNNNKKVDVGLFILRYIGRAAAALEWTQLNSCPILNPLGHMLGEPVSICTVSKGDDVMCRPKSRTYRITQIHLMCVQASDES